MIFDYTYPEVIAGTCDRAEAREWLKITHKYSDPLVLRISEDKIEQFLEERGFSKVVRVSCDYFNKRYFTGANQGMESTPVLTIAHAQTDVFG